LIPSKHIYTNMIKSYGEAGDTENAILYFDMMVGDINGPDKIAYDTLFKVFARSKQDLRRILPYFEMMCEDLESRPDITTFTIVINAICRLGYEDVDLIDHFYNQMERFEVKASQWIYYSIIGSVNEASKIAFYYEQMVSDGFAPDQKIYSKIIAASAGDLGRVEELFLEMTGNGIKPTIETFNQTIHLLAGGNDVEKVQHFMQRMRKDFKLKPDIHTFNVLLDLYAKRGDYRGIIIVLHQISSLRLAPDLVTYTTIMDGFTRSNYCHKAIWIWKSLVFPDWPPLDLPIKITQLDPDCATICVALDACKFGFASGRNSNFQEEAYAIWDYAQKSEVELVPNCLTSLVECLISFGQADVAVEFIERGFEGGVMPDKKTITIAREMMASRGFDLACKRLESVIKRKEGSRGGGGGHLLEAPSMHKIII